MITQLHVRNFKCFVDQAIPFGKLSLLSGLNGSGKSSLLQVMLLLRQSYQQGLLSRGQLALNGDLVQIGNAPDAIAEGATNDEIAFEIQTSDERATWSFRYDTEVEVLQSTQAVNNESIFQNALFVDSFRYLQAERLGPRTSSAMSDVQVRVHRQLGSRGEYTAHFLALFGNADMRNTAAAHPRAEAPSLVRQTEAWLSEVCPGIRLNLTMLSSIDAVSLRYPSILGEMVSNAYRPANVGFGVTYGLSVIVAALSADPGSLLIIENPEAHLHPRGQTQVGRLLALAACAGTQVIIETHSDHLLNGIRLAIYDGLLAPDDVMLHFFARSGSVSDVKTPKLDRNGRLNYWPNGFFDEWDKNLELLLQPRVTPHVD